MLNPLMSNFVLSKGIRAKARPLIPRHKYFIKKIKSNEKHNSNSDYHNYPGSIWLQ